MQFPAGSFERTGSVAGATPEMCFECGVCWQVYDPTEGDAVAQIAPGTPFDALPEGWTCPGCEASRHRFMPLPDGHG